MKRWIVMMAVMGWLLLPMTAWALLAAQVTCDTTSGGVVLLPQSNSYAGWSLVNSSTTVTIYLGPSGVSTTTGYPWPPGAQIGDGGSNAIGRDSAVGEAIYCITASSAVAGRLTW